MPTKRTKYFVLPAAQGSTGANFTDFDLSFGSVSLTGQEVTFVGSALVDSVFVRPGVSIDFVLSGSGSDVVYLSGRFADYSVTLAGTNMTIQRGAGDALEKVVLTKAGTVAISDRIVFADGTVNSLSLYNSLKAVDPVPLSSPSGETSQATQVASPLDAGIKAFALGDSGDTFAPGKPGVKMTLVGSLYADTVYIADGSNVDATLLGSGKDVVYFRGNWSDYAKSVAGNYVTFTRSINGATETVKVNSGSGGLNDQLVFADGAAGSQAAKTALVAAGTNAGNVLLSSLTDYDGALRTPGLSLAPVASLLDNVANLDVSSNIVLVYPEAVTAVSGKVIRIVNTGGAGFRGESTISTVDIRVDSTAQVQISGATVIINPTVDLDFGNDYYISIDAGAFTGASGKSSDAFEGISSLNFSTVTPGTTSANLPTVSNAATSVAMGNDGKLIPSFSYLDIEGIGNPAAGVATAIDLSGANVALVFKDYDPSGPDANLGYDGVRAGNFNVAVNGFGAGDRIYVDNQSLNANNLGLTAYSNPGTAPTTIQFAGNDLGGFINLTVAGSNAGFSDATALKAALGNVSYDPIVSDGLAEIAADTSAPVIGPAATLSVAENTTRVASLSANEPVTWSIARASGSVSPDAAFFTIEGSSTLAFASAPNYEQADRGPAYSVRVVATDTAGNVSTSDVIVNVTDVNEAPVASGSIGAQTAAVGQAFTLSLAGSLLDPDSATTNFGKLAYSFSPALPSWLTFNEANLTLSGTPTTASASASYTLKATDGGSPSLSASQTFSLSVLADLVVTGFTVSDTSGSTSIGKGGDPLTFSLATSEAVTVNTSGGTPTATFSVGGSSVVAQYSGGSGTATLTFVAQAPTASSGVFQLSALSLGGATVTSTTSASRSLATNVTGQTFSGYSLDNVAPALTVAVPIKVSENTQAVATLTTSEPVTFAALGTAGDSSFFSLSNGVLGFRSTTGQNFEQTGRSNTYSLPVTMTDNAGNTVTRTVTVELQDDNEFPVSAISDRNTAANSVTENSPIGTSVGYTAFATDADGSNNKVSYKLLAADGTADYAGKLLQIDASTGVISVAGPIDYETTTQIGVAVRATSSDGSFSTAPVSIAVLNDASETVPIVLSSAPVISPSTTAISGTTAAGARVELFIGTSQTAAASVVANSAGVWSIPVSQLGTLAAGSNPVKFTASVGGIQGELTQSLLYSGAPSWTQSALTTALIRGTVDQALASDGKITHAEAVTILDAAISAAKAATGAKVGSSILADLRAISSRGDSIFTSPDLTGKESGYLGYVFDKVVNTSAANSFYTGGQTSTSALGNLNADSPVATLEKLRDKWLLGKDLPDPRTQGDTANPNASAASGVYKAFSGVLVSSDGFNTFDVAQGSAGTCYLLASAAAVAEAETFAKTAGAPAALAPYKTALEQVFSANSGTAPSWGVRFYDAYGKPHWVTVNNQLVVANSNATSPSYARVTTSGSGQQEMWVPLLEKAYAQANEIGIFGRAKAQNAFFAIEGGLAEPIASLIGGGVSFYQPSATLYSPNFYSTVQANANNSADLLAAKLNSGQSLFMGSWQDADVSGASTFVSGHAFSVYDANRTSSNNTTGSIYNPWGKSSGGGHISPFTVDLSKPNAQGVKGGTDGFNDPDLMFVFHEPTIPDAIKKTWASSTAKKASSAPVSSAAAAVKEAVEGTTTSTAANLSQDFLKIGAGTSTAFADNGSDSFEDDRQGLFDLSVNESGSVLLMLVKDASNSVNLADLKVLITGATSADAFHAEVQAAKNQGIKVHFGLQLSAPADITADGTPESGVTVGLAYPAAPTSGTITLGPTKQLGDVAAASNPEGSASLIEHTMLTTVGHAVSFDDQTQAVLYSDSKGYWKAGKFGASVSSYISLTWDHDGDASTATQKIDNDTFEVSAIHLQAIYDGEVIDGYELVATANENPDDIFVLYFNAAGELISSEHLSDNEALDAEAEYGFDVNDSGALGAVSVFLAEGAKIDGREAPDLYADEYGDLILVFSSGQTPERAVKLEGAPVNVYDFEEGVEAVIVLPGAAADSFLVYFQFSDDDVAAVTVTSDGEIALDPDGDIIFTELTPDAEAQIERATGIDVARDGDTAALSPLVTGDAGDNVFDSRGDGTNDRYKDSTGDDTYFGGEGDDLLMGIFAGEVNFASRGSNVFYGDEGNDRYAGMGDGDIFLGGSGSDAVWVNGASTAFELFRATPEQLALAQAFDESVATGYVIREKASGAIMAAFDAESVEFALDGITIPLNDLIPNFNYVG